MLIHSFTHSFITARKYSSVQLLRSLQQSFTFMANSNVWLVPKCKFCFPSCYLRPQIPTRTSQLQHLSNWIVNSHVHRFVLLLFRFLVSYELHDRHLWRINTSLSSPPELLFGHRQNLSFCFFALSSFCFSGTLPNFCVVLCFIFLSLENLIGIFSTVYACVRVVYFLATLDTRSILTAFNFIFLSDIKFDQHGHCKGAAKEQI